MADLIPYWCSVGALEEFQYINYAFQDQDHLSGYEDAAVERISAALKKYDPGQGSQRRVP